MGIVISSIGILVAKLPIIGGMTHSKYYQSAGYIIALLGLFYIAVNIKKK